MQVAFSCSFQNFLWIILAKYPLGASSLHAHHIHIPCSLPSQTPRICKFLQCSRTSEWSQVLRQPAETLHCSLPSHSFLPTKEIGNWHFHFLYWPWWSMTTTSPNLHLCLPGLQIARLGQVPPIAQDRQ
jgi:hypothetical protein